MIKDIRKLDKKLDNRGFTLVELLAVIAILSIIMTISIYTVVRVIKEAREKSYQVTVNNIEKESMNYLSENSKEIFFLSNNDIEYQCVTVRNLVDAGYFKNDIEDSKVSSDRNVKMNDYVYVERNAKTKAVIKTKLVLSDVEIKLCNMAIKSSYDVSFTIEPDTWSKSKEVEIKYKLNNPNSLDEYKYKYSVSDTASGIDGDNVYHDFSNNTVIVKYTAVNNGMINAEINYKDSDIDTWTKEISGIDNTNPVISSFNGDNTWKQKRDVKITLSDSESGLDKDNIKVKYGWSDSNTREPSSYIDGKLSYSNNDKKASFKASGSNITGKYYLWVKVDNFCDKVGNCVDDFVAVSLDSYWFDNEKPKVSISVDSYNKFLYSGEDEHSGIDKYYVSSSSTAPTDSSTWISDTSKTVTSKGTYYVWAKDNAGNISDSVSISAYTISKSVGTGTSLTIKYKNKNGDVFSGNSIVVLNGTKIWAKVTSNTGYENPVLKQNDNSIDNPSVISITKDVKISSSASAITYYITYDANGGSGAPDKTEYTYASSGTVTLSSTKPKRTGYTFKGWATSDDKTTVAYKVGAKFNKNIASNTTLYAVWEVNTYTISYNANGGSGAPSSQTKTYGEDLTLSSTKPTRTGYKFQGWATSSSGSVAYSVGSTYKTNADVTLHAVWKANTYTISYDANGGSGAPSSQTKTYGVNLTLSSTVPTRTGYTFKGWATSSSGSVAYSAGGTYKTNAAATLFAVWESFGNKITIHINGGDYGWCSTYYYQCYTSECNINSISCGCSSGYTFAGFSSSKNGSSKITNSYFAGKTGEVNIYEICKYTGTSTSGTVKKCGTCSKDSDCQSGLSCVQRYCSICESYKAGQCVLWSSCQ